MATERKHMQTDAASERYSNTHNQNYHDYPLAMEVGAKEVPDLLEVVVKRILPHRFGRGTGSQENSSPSLDDGHSIGDTSGDVDDIYN